MQAKKRQKRILQAGTALAMLIVIASLLLAGCKVMKADEAMEKGISGSAVEEPDAGSQAAQPAEKKESVISEIVGKVVMDPQCKRASISLLEINGKKELCIYKNTMTVGLLNDGEIVLKGIDLYTTGKESGEIMTPIRSAIGVGSSARQIVRYDEAVHGSLKEVVIVPVIKLDNGKEAVCKEKAIIDDSIRVCG